MLAAGGPKFPFKGQVAFASADGFGTDGGQYFMQTVAGAIASPADFSGIAAPIGGVLDLNTSYGSPVPTTYTPTMSAMCMSPSLSNVGTSFNCSTPALTASDTLTTTDQSMLLYGSSDTAFNSAPPTMSVVEESILSKAFRAATASIMPSLLTGETAGFTVPSTPGPSHKQRPSSKAPRRKQVSSTSQRVRGVAQKKKSKPRNKQMDIGEPGPDGRTPCLQVGKFKYCLCTDATGEKCAYRSERQTDLDRHKMTHCADRNHEQHICCGVPVEHAAAYGIEDVSNAYLWNGWWMVGGCQASFGRKDSLGRHIKNQNNMCKGNSGICSALLEMMRGAAPAGETMEDGGDD